MSDPNGAERKRLGDEGILAGLRLACQARACDSAIVTISPQSMTAPQLLLPPTGLL